MSTTDESRDPLDALGDEFLDRLRRGERPAVTEFMVRDPERAGEIREFLEALALIEGLKPRADDTVDAAFTRRDRHALLAERLGDFRIVRELGRGGMGVVYEAEQESLGRQVALKVLAPECARTRQQVRRFVREARSAARLHHTNIVPVFGVGEHDGLHYYAMQFIPGLGLDTVLEEVRHFKGHDAPSSEGQPSSTRHGLSDATAYLTRTGAHAHVDPTPIPAGPDDSATRPSTLVAEADSDARYARGVARIGLQVSEALAYAHQQGTLHRDVKPSNILLDGHGVAWVTDFGLAKATEDEDLTRTGDLVGTLRYMAPERFQGHSDARADVYGLGLVLYELLALRPAFTGLNRESLLFEVGRVEPPRLREVNPAVPRDLETIVHKAIEKAPADRYPTAAALAQDLKRFLENRPIVARRVGATERLTRWARRNPGLATLGTALAGMLALIVALIAVADLKLRREHADTLFHLRRAELAEADALERLLDSSVAHARASRQSRVAGRRADGLRALEVAARLDSTGRRTRELRNEAIACLVLPDIRARDPWPISPEEGYVGIDFDPNTGRLARGTPQGDVLFRAENPGSPPLRLPGNDLRAVFLRFSPDGRYLAVKHDSRGKVVLVVWDVTRSAKVLDLPDGVYADAVDFHPGGRLIAMGRRDGSIVLHDLVEGREQRRLPPGPVPTVIRFDPAGRRIAVVSPNSRESVVVRRGDDGVIVAAWSFHEQAFTAGWHPDGHRLGVGMEDGRLRLLDADDPDAEPYVFGDHDGQIIGIAFHPGGTMLASTSWDGTVRLWDARTGQELLKGVLPGARPIRFSRDGKVFGPGHESNAIWVWDVAVGAECRTLVGRDGEGPRTRSIDFLGNGSVLVTAGEVGVRFEPIASDDPARFVALPGTWDAAVLPDNTGLITSGEAGLLRWPIHRAEGGVLRVGPPDPLGPIPGVPTERIQLSRDGQTLVAGVDDEVGRLLVIDLTGKTAPISLSGHWNMERLDLSPDGRWIATGTWHGTLVKIWDARQGTWVRDLPIVGNAEVVFSPDGTRLVTASATEYSIWDTATWTERLRIPRSQASGLPGVVTFSRDGVLLALARTRTTVDLVQAATGETLATFEAPDPQNVVGLGFTPDGRKLVGTFNAARIRIWDLDAIQRGLDAIGVAWPEPGAGMPTASAIPERLKVVIEPPRWLDALARSEAEARLWHWTESAAALDEALAAGAPHLTARLRKVLFLRARGEDSAYRAACRELLKDFDLNQIHLRNANDLTWSCALGPAVVDDYEPLIRQAERSASSRGTPNRLNTLGTLLFRAGRFEEARKQLERSIAVHAAGGTQYDALVLAMVYHRLRQRDEARKWYQRGTATPPPAMHKPEAIGDTSWIPRLELEILRREAAAQLGASPP